jgi:hypothetical protein
MYVRISRGRFNPATEGDVQRVVEEQVVPAMQRLPGLQRYMGGLNRSAGILSAVSLWDTEAHANFSRDVLMGAVPALTALGVTLEPAEIYEVTVDI